MDLRSNGAVALLAVFCKQAIDGDDRCAKWHLLNTSSQPRSMTR
ncbi:MAG: hypothetical protein OFPI_08180 [Osedax symbiont Rs2]|nr:MAG: hypothetical protein OFPI_08180 [Osedax symbiont Rs2]